MAQRLGPKLLERVPAGGPGGRARRLPQSARAAGARAAAASAPADVDVPQLGALRGRPAGAGTGTDRVRHGAARLRLPVHLLHRSVHARARSGAASWTTWSARCAGWPSRAPREVTLLGQTVNSYHDGTHDFADLLRAVGAVDGIRRIRFTSRRIPTDFTDRRHRGDGHDAGGVRARAPAGAERVECGAPADAAPLHPRALPRGGGASCGRRCPAITLSTDIIVGFPGRDRGRSSRRRCRWWRRPGSTTPTRSSTRCARARRRCGSRITSPTRWRRSGSSGSSSAVRAQARRRNMARVGEVHEVLVERPAQARRPDAGPHAAATTWCWWTCRRRRSVTYHTVRLTGTTGSTFTGSGRTARPGGAMIVNVMERHVSEAYDRLAARSRTSSTRPSIATT